ncbi:hypothetical protein ACQPT2_11255 [Erwinia amylovora]
MKPDYSSDAFKEFLMEGTSFDSDNQATLRNLKNTGLLLMSNVNEGEFKDMRNVDPHMLLDRHYQVTGNEMSSGSFNTYKSRFNSAVGRFIMQQNNAAGIKSDLKDIIRNNVLDGFDVPKAVKKKPQNLPNNDGGTKIKVKTFNAPLMLRPLERLSIEITGLPADLNMEEAELIASFLRLCVKKDK